MTGSDPTGLMYGALDVAEQIRWSGARSLRLRDLVQTRWRAPYLELRGVNQFLHQQALDDPNSWYYSEDFWREYLDALARSRHNFLDLHGLYDMDSTGFPNLFPYFIHLEEYPEADVGPERTARNLAVLQQVIALAADRGIKVGLMNYNAAARVPPGKLADYTAKCVERLLRECPGLWAFGFRIGESGQPEDFFRYSYIAGVRKAESSINLYTRSWIASRAKIMEIAGEHPGRFLVEIKYNGEHLGLPYQVQGERMATWGSYSFQTYTNRPKNYSILWQIRACGTHRIFQWGDPQFCRRTVRTCRLGQGAGFSVEPMSAYYPVGQYYLNPRTFPQPFFRWEFERNWFWYDCWGRTGYDPTVPDETFEALFRERYGNAGPRLFRSMLAASRIIPLIYSYHCLGPDHRNMAPEFETGNGHSGDRRPDGTGVRNHYGLDAFLSVEPLDDTVMDSPRRYVDKLMSGQPPGPFGPEEAASELERAADMALRELSGVRVPPALQSAVLDQVLDARALAALARYYAKKIRGVTHLALFERTGDLDQLDQARALVAQSHAHWEELAQATEEHFTPVTERLRMYTVAFTWREEGQDLPRELEWLDARRRETLANPPTSPTQVPLALFTPSRRPAVSVTAVSATLSNDRSSVTVAARIPGLAEGASVSLAHRPLPSFYSWTTTLMERAGEGLFTATVPLTPEGLVYRLVISGVGPRQLQWPDFRSDVPYAVVPPWRPGWVSYGAVSLREGAPVYTPAVGEPVFSDSPRIIEALPEELTGLVGLRYPEAMLRRAQDHSFGGYDIPFRVHRPCRLFVAFPGAPPEGWGRYARRGLTVGGEVRHISARDYPPGDYRLVFPRGPIPIILGFRALGPEDKPLEMPSVNIAGHLAWDALEHDFVATTADFEFYHPRLGERVYTDRQYAVQRIPEELETCIGLRFSNERAKTGGLVIPFRLARPATLYIVFGSPEDGPWQKPLSGWTLYARDGYQHGPGDERPRSIYCRQFSAGDHSLTLEGGTAVVLGFK